MISYRYLSFNAALQELHDVKLGRVNHTEALDREDFHLRPFTEAGVSKDRLLEIRRQIFAEIGVSNQRISEATISFSQFDKTFTRIANSVFHDMNPIDGFNKDVWSYLTMRLLPDLALWRWEKNKTDERFLGGLERSCFQRLWLRSYVLGGELASKLQEDEAISIFERPEAIGGNRRLSLVFANYIVQNRGAIDVESGEKLISTDVVKQVAKRLRRNMSIQVVQSMTDEDLENHLDKMFKDSLVCKLK